MDILSARDVLATANIDFSRFLERVQFIVGEGFMAVEAFLVWGCLSVVRSIT